MQDAVMLAENGSRLACLLTGAEEAERLKPLAARLGLPLCGEEDRDAFTHFLVIREGRLCLAANTPRAPSPTCVDFLAGALRHRRATSGKSQGIGLAVGIRKLAAPRVLDATAGLGRDAFILAALGCRVQLLERSPVIHALLEDGFRRAREAGGETVAVLERMSLHLADARTWLRRISEGEGDKPDVVYLDAMFPPRESSAKVKKDISLLQQLLGSDEDFGELIELARRSVRHRVVVKRPGARTGEEGTAPNFQVGGKACHFDVYLPC